MGSTLASGNIPAWNPHVMTGIPFAADPIHGWMNLPAMVLFTLLPCGTAIAFGPMAAGQLSDGLILGAGALVVFAGARLIEDVRNGRRSVGQAASVGGVLAALIVPLNLAFLLPRLGYLPETQVSLGYR